MIRVATTTLTPSMTQDILTEEWFSSRCQQRTPLMISDTLEDERNVLLSDISSSST